MCSLVFSATRAASIMSAPLSTRLHELISLAEILDPKECRSATHTSKQALTSAKDSR